MNYLDLFIAGFRDSYFNAFQVCRYEDCVVFYGFDEETAMLLASVLTNAFVDRTLTGAMDETVFNDADHALALVLSRFSDLALQEYADGS